MKTNQMEIKNELKPVKAVLAIFISLSLSLAGAPVSFAAPDPFSGGDPLSSPEPTVPFDNSIMATKSFTVGFSSGNLSFELSDDGSYAVTTSDGIKHQSNTAGEIIFNSNYTIKITGVIKDSNGDLTGWTEENITSSGVNLSSQKISLEKDPVTGIS